MKNHGLKILFLFIATAIISVQSKSGAAEPVIPTEVLSDILQYPGDHVRAIEITDSGELNSGAAHSWAHDYRKDEGIFHRIQVETCPVEDLLDAQQNNQIKTLIVESATHVDSTSVLQKISVPSDLVNQSRNFDFHGIYPLIPFGNRAYGGSKFQFRPDAGAQRYYRLNSPETWKHSITSLVTKDSRIVSEELITSNKPDKPATTQSDASEVQESELALSPQAQSPESDTIAERDQAVEEGRLWVRVGLEEFPVLLEDGDFENLDKVKLIWTLNSLFEHVYRFEFVEAEIPKKYYINGDQVETSLYLLALRKGRFTPTVLSNDDEVVCCSDILEKDGRYHMICSRAFIEAYIEASKYDEITNQLDKFIDRLNRIQSAEFNGLTETQIDAMLYVDPRLLDNPSIEKKRDFLRQFTLDVHFQDSNVFWIVESTEIGHYITEDPDQMMIAAEAIYYEREDNLPFWLAGLPEDLEVAPPSNFHPRLHMEPGASEFVWVAAATWTFIHLDRKWKLAIVHPGNFVPFLVENRTSL